MGLERLAHSSFIGDLPYEFEKKCPGAGKNRSGMALVRNPYDGPDGLGPDGPARSDFEMADRIG